MIFGGALGNGYERVVLGRVTDMIDMVGWFVCNVADIALFCGCVLVCLSTFFEKTPCVSNPHT